MRDSDSADLPLLPSLFLGLLLAPGVVAQRAEAPNAAVVGTRSVALRALRARSIGPATMSGRVAAVAALPSDPRVIYVGAASGGLWKSMDGGLSFRPIFDEQNVQSIGAIAIHPESPEVLWVGTGEANPRNSAAVGRGIFRSLDGGKSFQFLGLAESERIGRICLDPRDTDVAWVAVLGKAWGDSEQRGVYRTRDGGKTWKRVLSGSPRTGCADLVQDPRNPNKLFAALWDFRRQPWFFTSGGKGSGLFVTSDGGDHWRRLGTADGMPKGELGRMGLAIARSDPSVVYALVEAKKNVLLRSDDGGKKFRKVSGKKEVAFRPFYFADIRVDPKDPNRIYNLASTVTLSTDGGRSFQELTRWDVHPDHHDLWIHPDDPQFLILGNDGGIAISRDRGAHWRFVSCLPIAQFYHIAVDNDLPYHVFGGLQDNGCWRGPSSVWENGGIRNYHWQEVLFGDGFSTLPLPYDSTKGYATSQQGWISRFDTKTGAREPIRPVHPDAVELRFSWNAPIALDPHQADGVYFGSQFVHYSSDRGDTWRILSPDLTSNDPKKQKQKDSGGLTPDVTGAENFTTLYSIAPSPIDAKTIWAGSDDGRVHVTTDGGQTWVSVEDRMPGLAKGAWCAHIEAGKHDSRTAYVVFDDHRRSNWAPYLYRTRDAGGTWERLGAGDFDGFLHVVEEDPVEPRLLFVGSEFGPWYSLDGGSHWTRLEAGIPHVPVRALAIQERENDLVLGTHGRSLFILDDIRVLRILARDPGLLALGKGKSRLQILAAPSAVSHRVRQTGSSRFPGHGEFRGENEPYGARVDLWIHDSSLPPAKKPGAKGTGGVGASPKEALKAPGGKEAKPAKLILLVESENGVLLRRIERTAHRGFFRTYWDLRSDGPLDAKTGKRRWGPELPPGKYRLHARVGDLKDSSWITVRPDPRVDVPNVERQEKWRRLRDVLGLLDELARSEHSLQKLLTETAAVKRRIEPDAFEKEERRRTGGKKSRKGQGEDPRARAVRLVLAFEKRVRALITTSLRRPETDKGIRRDHLLAGDLRGLYGGLQGSLRRPTEAQELRLKQLRRRVEVFRKERDQILGEALKELRSALPQKALELLTGHG